MNKYKVEFIQTDTYVIDVLAESEEQAKELSQAKWTEVCDNGTYHFHEVDTNVEQGTVYDVTNTDDPFDA